MVGSLAVILGTRPEIIKMAPVIRAGIEAGEDVKIIHTGQHYSHDMDGIFFEQLGLPAPFVNLAVGSASHGVQMGKMLERIEATLLELGKPRVLVHGDTNTTATGALVATRHQMITGHVEAGLRSHDRRMPEEHNRILTDHLCDRLYAPTSSAADNLRWEGIPRERVVVTGNTIVDAVQQNRSLATEKADALTRLGLESEGYILMTVHRQENVDEKAHFEGILAGVNAASATLDLPVVYAIHPRAEKKLQSFGLDPGAIQLVPPQDYLNFLELQAHAKLVVTDSGGLQEECCILQVPCVTVRDNTERPETVEVGANMLAGVTADGILESCQKMAGATRSWSNPFGDGRSGERIVKDIMESGAISSEVAS